MNGPAADGDAQADARRLHAEGRIDEAIACLEDFLRREPKEATAHFNLALLYKSDLRYPEALAAYENAIRLGIDRIEEVYSNAGVLLSDMRRPDEARAMYAKALEIDAGYAPALFNLAGLLEETGDRDGAVAIYRRLLSIDPGNREPLARIAHAVRTVSEDDALIGELREAIDETGGRPLVRESLLFALGKALDDAGAFEDAFSAYRDANALGTRRMAPYRETAVEEAFDGLIRFFDDDRVRSLRTESRSRPIFICGMYRSGSTLVEQILSAHPSVTAGGELGLLPWLVSRRLLPYPQRLGEIGPDEIGNVADEYTARVSRLFPRADHVTDKRPDNFLHVGLVKAMFPEARIVHTRRERRDNCLSVWFQQLGGHLNYATDLAHTAHYYRQQERLMAHWRAALGESVFTVDYDRLVREPEPVLRELLGFLGLPWDEACLRFEESRSQARTASVWQVREALHTRSSGRWRRYAPFVGDDVDW